MKVIKDISVCSFPCIISDDGRILVKNLCDNTLEVMLWKDNNYVGSANFFMPDLKYFDWLKIDNYLFDNGGWSCCTELEDLTGYDWRALKDV